MLTVKYDRKDFFGLRQYTEDNLEHYGRDDVKKAFLFLGKDRYVAVQKENVIYCWDSTADYDDRIMTVRTFDTVNNRSYEDKKMAFDKVKREVYAAVQ